jgi:8-oxo-dGTP pyrophosphatase MutT (NUDIX family)
MTSFRIVGSEVVADAGFLTITGERVVGPDGEEFDRVVVRHPGAVVIVPVIGDEVVFVRQYRVAIDQDLLEVPAGKRDVDGEPPEETARRELEEEIGHRPGRLVKLAEFFNTPGFCDEHTHLYLALDLEDLGASNTVSPEEREMTVERLSWTRIDELIAAGELTDAKSLIGVLLARRYLDGDR